MLRGGRFKHDWNKCFHRQFESNLDKENAERRQEDVSDLYLQKYSGSTFLFSKRSAVNPFWRDVFSSFARFSERCIPQTISEILREPILFHHKIKIDGTVISRQVWRRLGIRTIGQLASENFEFLQHNRFTTKFGNDINFLEYYGMIKAIKKYEESLQALVESGGKME